MERFKQGKQGENGDRNIQFFFIYTLYQCKLYITHVTMEHNNEKHCVQ